ncbi:MAG TPA: purine phosphoribosyltransferase family protein, partial [Bacteroides sp.]|nr:purine phosphoribosyltransferase family protein [Bacteroides sp.]
KPGKLPAAIISVNYDLEYGKDTVEVHVDAIVKGAKYLVVDDLLATGGTAEAVCRLIEAGGGIVAGCLFLVELQDLGGRGKLSDRKVVSILEFDGE